MMMYINGQDINQLVVGLIDNGQWWYGPEALPSTPESFLAVIETVWSRAEVTGFVLISGPGSPTALRASHALVNTLAFTHTLPIFSIEKPREVEDATIIEKLSTITAAPASFPHYGSEPKVTTSTRDALKRPRS